MGDKTKIEWTDVTWNPLAGCTVISPGCKRCYAMRLAARLERMGLAKYAGLTDQTKAGAVWNGKINFDDDALLQPLNWKKPRRIFVNSMSDLFHESVPDEWIDKIFAVMALAPQHVFQVLTKRADRMRAYLIARNGMGNSSLCRAINQIPAHIGNRHGALEMPLPNVWLGVSVEDQQSADERIPDLLATPAAVRFLSCEPLIGPLDLSPWLFSGASILQVSDDMGGFVFPPHTPQAVVSALTGSNCLHWVIAGGESGPGSRPAHPDWFRSLRAQCAAAGVPFFFKQWGEHHPAADHDPADCRMTPMAIHLSGQIEYRPSEAFRHLAGKKSRWAGMCRVGKKRAGRLLDGVTHDGMPGDR